MVGEDEFVGDEADMIDDEVGLVGVAFEVIRFGAAAEDEDAAIAHLDGAEDVGFHGIADHDGLAGAEAHFGACGAHHDGGGFADGEGLNACGAFDHGDDGTAAGTGSGFGGAIGIEVGGDEAGALFDQADAAFDHFEGEGAALADDDEVGIVIDDGVAVAVECGGEAVFTDDVSGAAWFLGGEEASGGHGAGKDVVFGGFDAEAAEFEGDVAACALGVIGEEAEGEVVVAEALDEVCGAWDET